MSEFIGKFIEPLGFVAAIAGGLMAFSGLTHSGICFVAGLAITVFGIMLNRVPAIIRKKK